jgi:hypothetical protein
LIVRGGDVATINGELSSLGMRPVNTAAAALPMPQVAFIWSPMTGGSPMIPALRPGVFWPGAEYVDWVGTSFYSKFPNFRFLTPYYKKFAVRFRKPFAFVEWAIWDSENPSFVRDFFAWVGTHRRTQMISYNHGSVSNGPFELTRYPRSAAVIRSKVSRARFLAWAPEWRSGQAATANGGQRSSVTPSFRTSPCVTTTKSVSPWLPPRCDLGAL